MRKSTVILSSLAVIFTLASCEKANFVDNRISVSAEYGDASSKTTIDKDGHTVWTVGDEIKVIGNNGDVQVIKLDETMIDGKKAKFMIDSESTILYAVYPAAIEAKLSGEKLSIVIPEIQDGSFASANICVAKGEVKDHKTELGFHNATGIFKFRQSEEEGERVQLMTFVAEPKITVDIPIVKSVGMNCICGNLDITFSGSAINVTPEKKAFQGHSISVKGCEEMDEWYIAVAPGKQEHIDVIYMTTEGHDGNGYMFPYQINDFTVQRNHIQPVKPHTFADTDNNMLHVLVLDDGSKLKFAQYNIGAARKDADFSEYNYIGNFYSYGQPTTLALFTHYDTYKDIATENWGEDWRMPNKKEMQQIIASGGTQIPYSGTTADINKWHTIKGSLAYSNVTDKRWSRELPIAGYAQDETTWYGKCPATSAPNTGKLWYWTGDMDHNVPVFLQIDVTGSSQNKNVVWYTITSGKYDDRTLNGMLVRPVYDPK